MSKPLIQIDDLVREMTDEEHAQYLEDQANAPTLPIPDSATDSE
jgi:hypothetical protein